MKNAETKSDMRFSFNTVCNLLLYRRCENKSVKAFNNLKVMFDFFNECFCYDKKMPRINSEYYNNLLNRSQTQKYFKQHDWLKRDWSVFFLDSFNFEECKNRIIQYFKKNKVEFVEDFCSRISEILTSEQLGFNCNEDIDGFDKNEFIITFILNDLNPSDKYTIFIFMLLTAIYPCSYGEFNLEIKCDHSDDLLKYIEKYKKEHGLQSISYAAIKNANINYSVAMTEFIRLTAKTEHDIAAEKAGRFISPLLTKKYLTIENPTLCNTYSGEEKHISLETIIKKHIKSNIMITGRGGCGKTYTLFHLTEKLIEEKSRVIPVYIPLNGFNHNHVKNDIIIDYFCTILAKDSKFSMTEVKFYLEKWLHSEHDETVLLLLDGFNEITSTDIQIKIANEIKDLQARYAKLRFVITSRYDMKEIFICGDGNISHSFLSYSVDDLSPKTVIDYIYRFFKDDARYAEEVVQKAMTQDKMVRSFLQNPMPLVMYCYMNCENDQKQYFPHPECSTLGELIENFVCLVGLNTKVDDDKKHANEKAMEFLQYVGYCMNNDGVFKVSSYLLNRYAADYRFNIDVKQWEETDIVKDMLKFTMSGKMVTHIEFVHQNYRDFFAASYLKSVLNGRNSIEINRCFQERMIPEEICILLGDILEEHMYINVPANNTNSVIQSVLKEGGKELSSTAISQLIRVASIARKNDLSNFDFSDLDLSVTSLNRIKLYKNRQLIAKFDRTVLNKTTMNAKGHPGAVYSMLLIENNRFLITFSKLGIFCFDMERRSHYHIADYDDNAIWAALSIDTEKIILTGDSCGKLTIWEYNVNDKYEIKLNKIESKALYNTEKLDSDFLYIIQDLLLFNGRIYISVAKGDLWNCIILGKNMNNLELIHHFPENNELKTPHCRITSSESTLYCSSGSTLTKFLTSADDKLNITGQITFPGIEIIDISIADFDVDANDSEDILINAEMKGKNSKVSKLIKYSFEKDESETLKLNAHTQKRVGFRGWNSFSEPYRCGVYLTANIEDASETEPGLLRITFPNPYDEKIKYTCMPVFGNRHSMSVNCAVAFNYDKNEFLATGSTERAVEILSAEGVEPTLLYHLKGHDNGIHYIDIVNRNILYAAHYSGEVSEWIFVNNRWHCDHVYEVHDNNWVWKCKHISPNGNGSFVLSCSYDNTIVITDTDTEEIVCRITEPTSRVLSFGFLSDDIIMTGYTKNGNSILRKFRINYGERTSYTCSPELTTLINESLELRSIHSGNERLLLCANGDRCSYIYLVPKSNNANLDDNIDYKRYEINEPGFRINLRCADEISINGQTITACGGDGRDVYGNLSSYVRVWFDDKEGETLIHFNHDNAGCSALKLTEYRGNVFLIAGSYSGFIWVYNISQTDKDMGPMNTTAKFNNKILNIKVYEDMVYCSLLSGSICTFQLRDLIKKKKTQIGGKEVIRTVSGLRCCNVDFSNAIKHWDDDFRNVISYYGRIGRQ